MVPLSMAFATAAPTDRDAPSASIASHMLVAAVEGTLPFELLAFWQPAHACVTEYGQTWGFVAVVGYTCGLATRDVPWTSHQKGHDLRVLQEERTSSTCYVIYLIVEWYGH